MKKLELPITAAAMAASVLAQTIIESKTLDNLYTGINGGVATKTTGNSWMKNSNPNAGLRIGRSFTSVFGMAAGSNAYSSSKSFALTGTVVRALSTSSLGIVNLSNWFGGYTGGPCSLELVDLYGFGRGYLFGNTDAHKKMNHDNLISKAATDFVFNLGTEKAWQFYVESAIVQVLNGDGTQPIEYNINKSAAQLNAGFVYRFKNFNGTNSLIIAQSHDQAETDGLNAQVNSPRSGLNGKGAQLSNGDRQISDLQKTLEECKSKKPIYVKPTTATDLQPTVLFRVGQSVVDRSQMPNVETVAKYMKNHKDSKITIKGYASLKDPVELNQRLSENRAKNVKNLFIDKCKIAPSRLTVVGMGVTDKLFKEYDFNRAVTFNDDTSVE